ncbi:MAG: peptidoglycan-binding protein [Eubacteriaceae bacterium]|nr:peptidoglycan-binding protein [Eubacteriaceae bacterium]
MNFRRSNKGTYSKCSPWSIRQYYIPYAGSFVCERAYDVVPDGIFGPRTIAAVRQFQRDQGLSADEAIGPLTQNRLFR